MGNAYFPVGGSFYCSDNHLVTLAGCPKEVPGTFNCGGNKLITLNGCPKKVGDGFYCGNNKLISLEGLNQANNFYAEGNSVSIITSIGVSMIRNKISFLEAIILYLDRINTKELVLIMDYISPQKILELNDFKLFNFLRTNFPQKYAEVMTLRDVDLSADLGELGF